MFLNSDWHKYKLYRNKLTTLIRLSKQLYSRSAFLHLKHKEYMPDMEKVSMTYLAMQERKGNLKGLILFALLKTQLQLVIQRLQWIGFFFPTFGHNLASGMPDAVVLDILHTIWCNIDSGVYTCGIFIDLKKAFHTVNHSILPGINLKIMVL